jgi:ribonuclease HI
MSGGMVGTNQLAEMEGLRQAMLQVPAGETARIITDSQYAIYGITTWRARWEEGDCWMGATGPVKYKERWQEMYAIYDKRRLQLVHVRGHRGLDPMNELADALAGLQRAVDEGRASPEELKKYLDGIV